jgi:cell division inhibitor SepF
MGFFDRLLDVIRLNDDDDDYEDDYNEDDDLEDEDEEDDEEDFEDDKPKKRFWQKFSRKSDDDEDELDNEEDDLDDEDEEDDEEDTKERKSFSFFRSRKSSSDEDDEEDEDDEDEDEDEDDVEEERPRASRASRGRSSSGTREKSRARRETSRRSSQKSYTASYASSDRTSSRSSYDQTDWSSMVTEKPVKNTRNDRKKRTNMGHGGKVEVIRPESMEDTQDIAETLMANSTVVINLEGIDVDTAQRIIDFSCGACYSLHGGLQKVSTYFYILTPENVSISGDYTSLLNGDFDFPSMRSQY